MVSTHNPVLWGLSTASVGCWGGGRPLSGVGFLREAHEQCLSTGHYLSQALDFIAMASWLP